MSKIKRVSFYKDVFSKTLEIQAGHDFFMAKPFFLFNLIDYVLPFKFRHFEDKFLIEDNKNVKAFLSLKKVRGCENKAYINSLLVNPNSFEYGEELINYAISKYKKQGIKTFNIKLDYKNEETINFLTKTVNFRQNSSERVYKINNIKNNDDTLNYFYSFNHHDAKSVYELDKACINSYQLNSFEKSAKFFEDNLFDALNSLTSFKYIFRENENIYGFFTLSSLDNKNYLIDFVLDFAYNPYFLDILSFCHKEIQKRQKNFSIYVRLKKYYTNYSELEEIINNEEGFELVKENAILTKDCYVSVKDLETSGPIFVDALNLKTN